MEPDHDDYIWVPHCDSKMRRAVRAFNKWAFLWFEVLWPWLIVAFLSGVAYKLFTVGTK